MHSNPYRSPDEDELGFQPYYVHWFNNHIGSGFIPAATYHPTFEHAKQAIRDWLAKPAFLRFHHSGTHPYRISHGNQTVWQIESSEALGQAGDLTSG